MTTILNWFKPPNKPLRKGRTAFWIMIILVAITTTAFAIGYALLNQGDVVIIGDAIYRSYTPDDASGSGIFDSFLRISGNTNTIGGYNTDWKTSDGGTGSHEFPDAQDPFTKAYMLSSVPIVTDPDYPGVYREFQLDINQTPAADITLDEVEIYLTINPNLTGYPFGTSATKIYELDDGDDNWVRLNYKLAAGSGKRDMILRIPDALFRGVTGYPYCEYTAPACGTYVVLYSHFGGDDEGAHPNDDGGEEWGTQIYELASKSGHKFEDLDRDGEWDDGEPGLEGWTIYVDINGNEQFDLGEPSAVTDSTGYYEISNIVPNPDEVSTWKVFEVPQSGWYCSSPDPCYHEDNFAPGEVEAGYDFGNYQLALDVTKDVNTAFTRTYEWTIDKDFDGDYSMFAGDSVTHGYEVVVTKTSSTDSGWSVSGNIYIANNMPEDATIKSVSDELTGGTPTSVSCPVNFPYILTSGSDLTCTYSANPGDGSSRTNTAIVVTSGVIPGGTATEEVDFNDNPTITEVNASITVNDTNGESWGPVSDSASWTYNKDYTCSDDPNAYTSGGTYSFSNNNTATIGQTGPFDTVLVTVDCYAPVVSKTAAGGYDERHEWDVTKTVAPLSQSAFAGDTVSFDWTVTVAETIYIESYSVTGSIMVENPNPDAAMTVSLSDALDDGTAATIGICTDGTFSAGILNIPASRTANCTYSASPADDSATENTATATLNAIDFTGSDAVEWSANVTNRSATLDDDQYPYSGQAVDDGFTSTYTRNYTCSDNPEDYTDGMDLNTQVPNTAIVYSESVEQDRDTATTVVDCYAPIVTKTADETYTRTYSWTIDKVGDQTALTLSIEQTFLVNYDVTVNATYTDSLWAVDGTIWIYNPAPVAATINGVTDEVSPDIAATVDCGGVTFPYTLASLGTLSCSYNAGPPDAAPRSNTATATLNGINFTGEADVIFGDPTTEVYECIDVTDDQYGPLGPGPVCYSDLPQTFSYSMSVGPYLACGDYTFTNVASFVTNDSSATGSDPWTVNINVKCGGCTRTPGYWKNHSEYGPAPYDDTWALMPNGADTLFFGTGQSWYEVMWTPPKGNAYYILARAYAAAYLNQLNGAYVPSEIITAMSEAEALLDAYDGEAPPKGSERREFIRLAELLDDYNNGRIGPGHCKE